MSSILKALKKLEDEKTIRKPDSLKIDSEILRGDASQRFSTTGILLLAAFLFVCGSGATYFFMKPDTKNIAGTKSQVSAVEPSRQTPSAAVATVTEKPQGLRSIQADLKKSGKAASPRSDFNPDNTITTQSSAKTPVLTTKAQPVQQSKQAAGKQSVVSTQKAPVSAARTTTPVMVPSLKVNGIAFQDESADRVAIINGISVSNGSLIEGAKVEDIQKDRVRFSYGGEHFDVALGKSNR